MVDCHRVIALECLFCFFAFFFSFWIESLSTWTSVVWNDSFPRHFPSSFPPLLSYLILKNCDYGLSWKLIQILVMMTILLLGHFGSLVIPMTHHACLSIRIFACLILSVHPSACLPVHLSVHPSAGPSVIWLCPEYIFWAAEPFVTKLGMPVHHHGAERCVKKVAVFKVKVTVRSYVMKIWLFSLRLYLWN